MNLPVLWCFYDEETKLSPVLCLYCCLFATVALMVSRDEVCVAAGPGACARIPASPSSLLNAVTVTEPFQSHAGPVVTLRVALAERCAASPRACGSFGRFGSAHQTLAHLPHLHLTLAARWAQNPPQNRTTSESSCSMATQQQQHPQQGGSLPFPCSPHVYRHSAMASSTSSNTSFQSISWQPARGKVSSH